MQRVVGPGDFGLRPPARRGFQHPADNNKSNNAGWERLAELHAKSCELQVKICELQTKELKQARGQTQGSVGASPGQSPERSKPI
jgi:hypothetical protein